MLCLIIVSGNIGVLVSPFFYNITESFGKMLTPVDAWGLVKLRTRGPFPESPGNLTGSKSFKSKSQEK